MAHALASETENLRTTYFQFLEKKLLLETDTEKQAARNIYEEMLRKLSNTRIHHHSNKKLPRTKVKHQLQDKICAISY